MTKNEKMAMGSFISYPRIMSHYLLGDSPSFGEIHRLGLSLHCTGEESQLGQRGAIAWKWHSLLEVGVEMGFEPLSPDVPASIYPAAWTFHW